MLFLRGILIGLIFGVPAGAIGVLTIQRTLDEGFHAGFLILGYGALNLRRKERPPASVHIGGAPIKFPGVFIMIMSLLSASLTRRVSRKKLMVLGMTLCLLSGVGGLLFHQAIVFCFIWAILLGMGVGLWMPLATAEASSWAWCLERSMTWCRRRRTTAMEKIITGSSQVSARMLFYAAGGMIGAILALLLCKRKNQTIVFSFSRSRNSFVALEKT